MKDADYLSHSRALALAEQPHLSAFYDSLAKDDNFTIIVGAGLSIDAGLPSWPSLIDRMAKRIPSSYEGIDIPKLVLGDSDNLMRRAEQVINIYRSEAGYGGVIEALRAALYDGYKETQPGPIAQSLGHLARSLARNLSIVTTNFDDVLQVALSELGVSYATYTNTELEEWRAAVALHDDVVPILHVHGRVGRDEDHNTGEIVLTESEFLRAADLVQSELERVLLSSTVVFLGLSMTDPNMVASLWRASKAEKQPSAFAIFVPASKATPSIREERILAVLKADYLEKSLHLKSIFLKSYSQLEQLLQEVRVSRANLSRYKSKLPNSTAYTTRFAKLLTNAYEKSGLAPDGESLGFERRLTFSNSLQSAIGNDSDLRKAIAGLAKDSDVKKRLNALRKQFAGDDQVEPNEERFSLSVWLRNPEIAGTKRYSLRFVATSALIYADGAALPFQSVEVEPHAETAAALALLRGKGQFWNTRSTESVDNWSAVAASLLRVVENIAGERVTTPIGSMVLQSNFPYANATTREPKPMRAISVLAGLDPGQRRDLLRLLELAGQKLIG